MFATVGLFLVAISLYSSSVHGTTVGVCDEKGDKENLVTISGGQIPVTVKLNITISLLDLRIELEEKQHMKPQDKFLYPRRSQDGEISLSYVGDEERTLTCEILEESENQIVLYMGRPSDQIKNLANRFLHGVQYINNKWRLGLRQVAYFESNYQPTPQNPAEEVKFESSYTSSRRTFERAIEGIDEAKLSITTPFVSGSVEYSDSDSSSSSSSSETVYSFARLVRSQKEVLLEKSKLKPMDDFANELETIVRSTSYWTPLEKAKDLVKTLNKYGWLMPTHYIVGGSFRAYELSQKTSETNSAKRSQSLKASLEASYAGFGGGAGAGHSNSDSTNSGSDDEMRNVEKSSVGASGAIDMETFLENVKVEQNWQIIQHLDFYPTLLLMLDTHNWAFFECLTLLDDQNYAEELKKLQDQIDIPKYVNILRDASAPGGF